MIGRAIGNFVVLSQVGEGGMGVVYLAEHPLIGRQVAVKVLHPHLANQPQIVGRLFTEARSAFEVRSANIVEILDFGMLEDKTTYFVMEWLEGGKSLSTVLAGDRRLPVERAVPIALGITRALCAAHAQGIAHLDLKPDNIFLVERDGEPDFVKVLDFGIAKSFDEQDVGHDPASLVIGTPTYMSPEQCVGDQKRIGPRCDIYSLGIILYEMIVGRPPFGHGKLVEIVDRHLREQPIPPTMIDSTVPRALEKIILRALEKEPAARYQSAAEVLRELKTIARLQWTPPVAVDEFPTVDEAGATLEMGRDSTQPFGTPAATTENNTVESAPQLAPREISERLPRIAPEEGAAITDATMPGVVPPAQAIVRRRIVSSGGMARASTLPALAAVEPDEARVESIPVAPAVIAPPVTTPTASIALPHGSAPEAVTDEKSTSLTTLPATNSGSRFGYGALAIVLAAGITLGLLVARLGLLR